MNKTKIFETQSALIVNGYLGQEQTHEAQAVATTKTQTPPNSVNIEGVDQMVLISVEVPGGVNNSRWGAGVVA